MAIFTEDICAEVELGCRGKQHILSVTGRGMLCSLSVPLTASLSSNQTRLSELNKFMLSSYSKTASAKSSGKESSLGFTCNVLTNKWWSVANLKSCVAPQFLSFSKRAPANKGTAASSFIIITSSAQQLHVNKMSRNVVIM